MGRNWEVEKRLKKRISQAAGQVLVKKKNSSEETLDHKILVFIDGREE